MQLQRGLNVSTLLLLSGLHMRPPSIPPSIPPSLNPSLNPSIFLLFSCFITNLCLNLCSILELYKEYRLLKEDKEKSSSESKDQVKTQECQSANDVSTLVLL